MSLLSSLRASACSMSTPPRLSDDKALQPLLESTFRAAINANELYEIKASDLKTRLLDAGWTGPGASEEGWKKVGWKKIVSKEWKRMVVGLLKVLSSAARELIVCGPPHTLHGSLTGRVPRYAAEGQ